MAQEDKNVTIPPEMMQEIVRVASETAIEKFQHEAERNRKAVKDKRLHNTKLLLQNYHCFVEHSKSAVYEASQLSEDDDFEELMEELMRIDSPLASKPAAEVIGQDRKDYTEGRFHFALAQVEESNLELLHQRKAELAGEMCRAMERDKLDFFGLLVTDAVRECSELLMTGSPEVLRNLPYARLDDGLWSLPGVLSRKKQLLPQVIAIIAALEGN